MTATRNGVILGALLLTGCGARSQGLGVDGWGAPSSGERGDLPALSDPDPASTPKPAGADQTEGGAPKVPTGSPQVGGMSPAPGAVPPGQLPPEALPPEPGLPPEDECPKLPHASSTEIAIRMGRLLWGEDFLDALSEYGDWQLSDRLTRFEAAGRMLESVRAEQGLLQLIRSWVGLTGSLSSTELSEELALSLQLSADETIKYWLDQDRTLSEFLFSPDVVVTDESAATYYDLVGANGPAQPGIYELGQGRAAGLLTQGAWLATFDDPTTRGQALLQRLLCEPVPGIPPGFRQPRVEPLPNQTTRTALLEATSEPLCTLCHQIIDPHGFLFEEYDRYGNYRVTENSLPVDTQGRLPEIVPDVVGVGQLSDFLSGQLRGRVQQCAIQTFLQSSKTPPLQECEHPHLESLEPTDLPFKAWIRSFVLLPNFAALEQP